MGEPAIERHEIRQVLVIRLRSIGDTVLATPTLTALRRHFADARIDILLEDWVTPLLTGLPSIDGVIAMGRGALDRVRTAKEIRGNGYDLVINLHGGTTSTFLTRATGAKYRVGYSNYQYSSFYTHLLSSSAEFWGRSPTHSVEQQLALAGHIGVPVSSEIPTHLAADPEAAGSINQLLAKTIPPDRPLALFHPAAAFETKQWAAQNFARVAEHLHSLGYEVIAVAGPGENAVLTELAQSAACPIHAFTELTLPEITALASRAALFVGNDSGIAHIAAAVGTPPVVIFGSSNRDHWRPWTSGPAEVVFASYDCQPCPGYECAVFGDPKCIREVTVGAVIAAVERII